MKKIIAILLIGFCVFRIIQLVPDIFNESSANSANEEIDTGVTKEMGDALEDLIKLAEDLQHGDPYSENENNKPLRIEGKVTDVEYGGARRISFDKCVQCNSTIYGTDRKSVV